MDKAYKVIRKVIYILLVFIITVFIGYQIYSAIYSPYKIETVVQMKNENKLEVDGIFSREEKLVTVNHDGYIVHYLHGNGDKIGAGGTVAELYLSDKDVINYQKIKELNYLVKILEESQDKSSVLVTNADHITTQINNKINALSTAVYNNDFSTAKLCKNAIQVLLNRRNIVTEKEENFEPYISEVKNQINKLQLQIKNPLKEVKVKENGNFVLSADGFEDIASPSQINKMSVLEKEKLIKDKKPDSLDKNAIGKLVTNFDWYYTIVLPVDDNNWNEKLKVGKYFKLRFNNVSDEILTVKVSRVDIDDSTNKMAVTFKSNYLTGEFCSARKETADIIFASAKGYKISKSAVRIVDGQKGVYVVIGRQMFFKKIDILYEQGKYIVCRATPGNDSIKPFDDVIVKGTDLYDGKTI